METPKFSKKEEPKNIINRRLELMKNNESLPFTGLNQESYAQLKLEEEEYPGFATPIDEIIEKCKQQGLKIEFGRNHDGSNMFLLPAQSDDLGDSLRFKHLDIDAIEDPDFKELVQMLIK